MTHNSIVTTQRGGSAVHVARIHHDKVDLKWCSGAIATEGTYCA